tara:strand:+ start:1336 stop:2814 length:1479 start_codon:yes stop_codon:yes gene_type:complete
MPLISLKIPKGQYRNGTDLMSQGRWRDINLVRWHEDALRPVGGWRQRQSVNLSGVYRTMVAWEDNASNRYVAAAAHDKLKIINSGGIVTDITPVGLTNGRVDAAIDVGYGSALYGQQQYGEPRQDVDNILPATVWSLDNWGEYLLAMSPDDGKLYEWQLNNANKAALISNAPTSCTGFMVTEERFVVCFGAGGDPRKVQWSDQENNTLWAAAATNQAGDINLQTNGTILAGVRTRGQSLILTSEDAHSMTYQGPPFVYGLERVGTSCGLIGAGAVATVDNGVFWMGRRSFFAYTGGRVTEVPCEVGDYVFSDINNDQRSKITATVNSAWNEIWWFYPSSGSLECDRYVAFDYAENIWMTGQMDRTSGVDRGVFRQPLYIKPSGILYEQEVGYDYETGVPFAETGPISIGNGDNLMSVVELIPDEKTQGDVTAQFKTRFYPNSTEKTFGPFSMSNPTSVRFQGRQVRMRVDGNAASDWRVGIMRLDARQGGRR